MTTTSPQANQDLISLVWTTKDVNKQEAFLINFQAFFFINFYFDKMKFMREDTPRNSFDDKRSGCLFLVGYKLLKAYPSGKGDTLGIIPYIKTNKNQHTWLMFKGLVDWCLSVIRSIPIAQNVITVKEPHLTEIETEIELEGEELENEITIKGVIEDKVDQVVAGLNAVLDNYFKVDGPVKK